MSVATPVTMPQLGETVVEGTITKWLKQEGETVERDEPLFELSTDKVDTEVPSPVAGTLVQIKVPEGQTVSVGTELAMIDAGGDSQGAESGQAEAPASPVTEEPAEAPASPVTEEPAEAPASPVTEEPSVAPPQQPAPPAPPDQPQQAEPAAPAAVAPDAGGAPDGGERSHILSPLVRRLAEEHGIDLSAIHGTGTGGRITKKDVTDFVESGAGAAPGAPEAPAAQRVPSAPAPQPAAARSAPVATAPAEPVAGEEVVPLSRMRQSIAAHMSASMQATARAWNMVEVDMESIVRVRQAAKDDFQAREGIALTYMPFVAKAVCDALLAFPDVNAELRADQMVRKHFVNLGIAVALDDGLIVPVVKGADSMNLVGLARAINDVATRSRAKKLNPDEVHGGTFTITNPGPFGSLISVPIINTPECAILAFDSIEKRPVVIDDAIAIRHMVYLSMSWDHRVIDGATAAKFLARLKQDLEAWDFGPDVGLPARA